MYISILSSLILGTILGRFYKFPILIPVCALAIISILIRSGLKPFGLTAVLIELIVFVVSVQIGYIACIVARKIPRIHLFLCKRFYEQLFSNRISSTTKIPTQHKYLK
jgi:hypothetical protein